MTRFAALAALTLALAPCAGAQSAAEYPDDAPDWRPFGEAVAQAEADGDILLIHAYAVWCGWCRRLDADTYTDDAVQAYLDEHYEVTRLDIESPEEVDFFGGPASMRELAGALGLTSTPTTVFFTAEGRYINRAPGYWPPDKFLLLLQYIKEGAYDMMSFPDYAEMMEARRGTATPTPAPQNER